MIPSSRSHLTEYTTFSICITFFYQVCEIRKAVVIIPIYIYITENKRTQYLKNLLLELSENGPEFLWVVLSPNHCKESNRN